MNIRERNKDGICFVLKPDGGTTQPINPVSLLHHFSKEGRMIQGHA